MLLSLAVILAGESLQADSGLNGRFWDSLNDSTKQGYVMGFWEGVKAGASGDIADQSATFNTFYAVGFTNGDFVKELDKLYANTQNVLIPIPDAIRYCALKLGGAFTNAQLEQKLIRLRKIASGSPEKKP